jgi:diguanylate cyclase (GGDEF)-like protein
MEPSQVLDAARGRLYEDPEGALRDLHACREAAIVVGDDVVCGRALAIEAAVELHRGDLAAAMDRLNEAEAHVAAVDDLVALTEHAAVRSHLGFFAGSYAESLVQAERSVELAERSGDPRLLVFALRSSCLVFGNLGTHEWPAYLARMLRLTVEVGDRYEEALSRNDLGHALLSDGDLEAAERQLQMARAMAEELAPNNRFLLGVLDCTRAEMLNRAGRHEEALASAAGAALLLCAGGEPNPYVFAVVEDAQVRALVALGRIDDAVAAGAAAVATLGDRVPAMRGTVQRVVAEALRDAGRFEEAFHALEASVELERKAFGELSELQRRLERAALETRAVRRQTDELTARNERLEKATERLRDQVDRDALTGLHNRRFLSRELLRYAADPVEGPFSIAVLDLDHFKTVNDRFGHDIGDAVLIRVAALLLGEMREQDAVVRTGGEEFVLLMPQTGGRAAIAACERLRTALRSEPWEQIAPGLAVTASIGVDTDDGARDLEAVVKRADTRLYEAKHAGRDRVVPDLPDLPVSR